MSESLFPSGPWTGFYKYSRDSAKHRMDLQLTFANGTMSGDGLDDIGRFRIKGRYDAQELECYWTKTYVGAHEVYYRGFREGQGIWGAWEIGLRGHGGFHIWPKASGEGEDRAESRQEPVPPQAIEDETVAHIGTGRDLGEEGVLGAWLKRELGWCRNAYEVFVFGRSA
jgi:hypothetical protein